MGCAISNFHSRIVDLSKRSEGRGGRGRQCNAQIVHPDNLHKFLSANNPNPKCIFIFGGSGSNKGQFIWDLMEQSCENYRNNKNNDVIKLIMETEEIDLNRFRFSYHYVDVEKLIVENLPERIKKLAVNSFGGNNDNNVGHMRPSATTDFLLAVDGGGVHKPADNSHDDDYDDLLPEIGKRSSKRSRKTGTSEESLKTQLLLYANIITNSWVLSLLRKEIKDNNDGPYEKIFIINLIPNRITLFKDCLFLKQTPSFINFDFNYVAVLLVKHSSRRKELEIKCDQLYDEINQNFVDYFRLIGKLIEVQVKSADNKIRFKLSATSKNAIRIATKTELISFIYMPKKDLLELDIFDFQFGDFEPILKRSKTTSLLFIINREIELDDQIVLRLEPDKHFDLVFLRKFIQFYRLTCYSLRFV